jgi:hypothetical protein
MRAHSAWQACVGLLGLACSLALASAQDRVAEFRKLAAQLVEQRRAGAEEKEAAQERALAILDELVVKTLTDAAVWPVDALNKQLTAYVGEGAPVGEGYRLIPLGREQAAAPAVLALEANFGLSGPSAVRVYSTRASQIQFRLAGRIDRFTHPDFFDEYLEVVPILESSVFVTVTGRVDEQKTGLFAAWRFTGEKVELLWMSDLLPNSSFEVAGREFVLSYCADLDEDRPGVCRKMTRERYTTVPRWGRVEPVEPPTRPQRESRGR